MIEFIPHYSSSKGNLYQISDCKTSLLLDPGVSIKQIKQALGFKLSGISGALAGHEHFDHSAGIPGLVEAGIDVYAGVSTIEAHKLKGHRVHPIEHLKQFDIGTFRALPFLIPHDVENFGFLIQSGKDKFLYLIDCTYCPYRFRGLTGIALGINFCTDVLKKNVQDGHVHPGLARRIMQSHCSLKTGLEFFEAQDLSTVKQINILHVSEKNADKDRIKRSLQKLTGKLILV